MPDRKIHLKFDEYLIDHDIVDDGDYSIVHDRMDRGVQYWGHWMHRELDPYHAEEGIRQWLRSWCHLAYQETLTCYLRIALGHLALDEMAEYDYEDEDGLIKSAYRSYAQRGFGRCFFREK